MVGDGWRDHEAQITLLIVVRLMNEGIEAVWGMEGIASGVLHSRLSSTLVFSGRFTRTELKHFVGNLARQICRIG